MDAYVREISRRADCGPGLDALMYHDSNAMHDNISRI